MADHSAQLDSPAEADEQRGGVKSSAADATGSNGGAQVEGGGQLQGGQPLQKQQREGKDDASPDAGPSSKARGASSSSQPQQRVARLKRVHDQLGVSKVDATADLLVLEDGPRVQLEYRSIDDGHVITKFPSKESADNFSRNTNRMRFMDQAQSFGLPSFASLSSEQQLKLLEQPGGADFLTIRFQDGQPSGFFCTNGLDPDKCGDAVLSEDIGSCVRDSVDDDDLFDAPDETMHLSLEDANQLVLDWLSSKLAPLLIRLDARASKDLDELDRSILSGSLSGEVDFTTSLDISSQAAGSRAKQPKKAQSSQSSHLRLFQGVCSCALALASLSCCRIVALLMQEFLFYV